MSQSPINIDDSFENNTFKDDTYEDDTYEDNTYKNNTIIESNNIEIETITKSSTQDIEIDFKDINSIEDIDNNS
ncbi:13199_t:CDS:1, partial [Dentiscutata heterogama]